MSEKLTPASETTSKTNGASSTMNSAAPKTTGPTTLPSRRNERSSSSSLLETSHHRNNSSSSSLMRSSSTGSVPTDSILVPEVRGGGSGALPPPEPKHRAVHRISLSALQHNYQVVQSAANKQRCGVIVVVKADGYGHGSIRSALHLADAVKAEAFAVATLEEGISLRKAFWEQVGAPKGANPPRSSASSGSGSVAPQSGIASLFQPATATTVATTTTPPLPLRCRPASQSIRILVLGPPVGFPRCFDDYFHYGIEVMVSGPEVALALKNWVADKAVRQRTMVERAARESQAQMVLEAPTRHSPRPSATLGNVSGQDLAKEVRALLQKQTLAQAPPRNNNGNSNDGSTVTAAVATTTTTTKQLSTGVEKTSTTSQTFLGIEEIAKHSRTKQKVAVAAANPIIFHDSGDDDDEDVEITRATTVTAVTVAPTPRKRLRWHALVDSGMGRLGFRTDPVSKEDATRRDSVEVIKELVDLENTPTGDCPIEFFGMCTHMADAGSSASDYTNNQMKKFKSLLKRVRAANIAVPTVSTDNSAALLTTQFTHFDPDELGVGADTRGYVRCGGAIYGQRPSFPQLRPISTLVASVRHVAVLKEGESVGYDRAYIAATSGIRIATLTIGFADGYPRDLGNGVGKAVLKGRAYPIAGNVCMDMLMVELGTEDTGVVVGDVAVLWGPEDPTCQPQEVQVPLQQLASTLGTTQSALTCGLDPVRVSREYE